MEPLPGANQYCAANSVKMSITPSVTLCSAITYAAVGLISYLIFKFSARLKIWLISKVTTSFEITGNMDPYGGIYFFTLDWLDQNVSRWTHQYVTAHNKHEEDGRVTTYFKKPPGFETSPHYFKHEGAWIQVTRKRLAETGITEDNKPIESITFRTLNYNGAVLSKILADINSKFEDIEPDETKTRFYYAEEGSYWTEFGRARKKRPLNSIILNESKLNSIINDIQEFRDSEDWYSDRGIPYRRGYLLYGPPGNGKSSFVKAIAGKFDYNICMLSLTSSKNMNDDTLNNLMNTTPENSIILLEDIDAAFPSRDILDNDDDRKSKKLMRSPDGEASSGKVTLRGLLNALDGVASTQGRIVFLTTNYVDRLDAAMTRPGRVDVKMMIALPNDNQIERMFTRFYPAAPEPDRVEFVKVIRGLKKPVSLAIIQGLFLFHKQSHPDAIASAVQYFDEQFFSLECTSE